jgi:hypothetical protein
MSLLLLVSTGLGDETADHGYDHGRPFAFEVDQARLLRQIFGRNFHERREQLGGGK